VVSPGRPSPTARPAGRARCPWFSRRRWSSAACPRPGSRDR